MRETERPQRPQPADVAPPVQRIAAPRAAAAEQVTAAPHLMDDRHVAAERAALSADWAGAPVQRDGAGGEDGAHTHAHAAAGIAGPAQALPHGDRIQASFGAGHDLSGVQAHVGGAAATAAAGMGATAYATGNHVAFAQQPDLHTAAHEAAHVVQQQQGVSLYGGVGKSGDHYEQHADAVADRVVAGKSAADLLGGATTTLGAGVQAKAIQRFGTSEHKAAGDHGSAGLTTDYQWGAAPATDGKPAAAPVVLTHGDLVALSGDFFDPRDTDEHGKPIPDSLFRCAGTPSRDRGKQPRTQDECLYALHEHNSGDPRFAPGGAWAGIVFGDELKAAVDSRYLRLAAKNDEHFQNPNGAGSGGPGSGNRTSGGGSYRALHEDAILRAHKSKSDGGSVADAMAHEAAAQHFLTDAFAAGHSRTPRGSIRSHWQGKYPLFFDNLKKAIAHETAIWMNANITNVATVFGSVQDITAPILKKVEAATAGMPAFGFDDVVSLVVHDMDNDRGLWVKNDLGDRWLTYGDGSFAKGDTAKHTEQAVALGCKDINNAYAIDASMSDDAVLAEVRTRSPSPATPGTKYAPEQAVPVADPAQAAANGTQNWNAASFEALWHLPVRTDDPDQTFATVISEGMKSGELHEKLGGMADKFPETEATGYGTVRPREGYLKGFFQPIVDNPYTGMRRIIHYDPSRGQSFNNTDDAVMEDLERMDAKDATAGSAAHASMKGLTLEQRIGRCKALIDGSTASDEAERIVEMFESVHDRAEARALYQGIEGHAWTGDWIQGWTVSDDDLWNNLSTPQLARVKTVLNR